jgi:5-(carboxyamino)imidazole ribonucleotide synthase
VEASGPTTAGSRRTGRDPILPGALLGVLGGGQLGMMFAMAARRMGYAIEAFSDSAAVPAASVCDRVHVLPEDDLGSLVRIGRGMAAVTFEFENVPVAAAEALSGVTLVRPSPMALATTQHRLREKAFLVENGFPCGPFQPVTTAEELERALGRVGLPAVLKTAAFGYDGKGQCRIDSPDDCAAAWRRVAPGPAILESWIDFDREVSVVAARSVDGTTVAYEPTHNRHRDHILDLCVAPSGLDEGLVAEATTIARGILDRLGYVGVACVEFFVTRDGRILVNEIAPRPHNSGHLTIDACRTSQFEQQVRAICGLPLGCPGRVAGGAAMANLLGECWAGGEPDWSRALAVPGVRLFLYGKSDPRPGRKMGHLTALADTPEQALQAVTRAREAIRSAGPAADPSISS